MKRQIKFRAWDDKNKIMSLPFILGYRARANTKTGGFMYAIQSYVIEQFTGLLDKNGKEIYEGDILKYFQPYSKKRETHIVKWDNAWACFGLFENGNKWCKESDWVKIKELEIIGNIHENPELL